MTKARLTFLAAMFLSLSLPTFSSALSLAEESTVNKVKDDAGDVKTNTKKLARTTKRKVRKATGNDNVLKDAKDKANDVGDDVSNEADKAKRR
jgi:hypothetical protein